MKWIDSIRTVVRHGKDASVSLVLERLAQRRVAPYGNMQNLSIDSTQKTIHFEISLRGETQPIAIDIEQYELIHEGLQTFFLAKKARASREWLQAAIDQFAVGRKWPVPEQWVSLLKVVL